MAKIVIAYASFGEGHKKGAEALKYLPDASVCDLLSFTNPLLRKIYSLGYLIITQYFPFLWRILFFFTKIKLFSSFVNKINRLIFSSFFKYLKKRRPKIIIVTHFFPSSLISSIKKKMNFKVISVITDLRVHPLWVAGCVDHYFAALEVTKQDLINLGVGKEKITTGFVPLREGFLKDIPLEFLRKKFYLGPRPSLIFVSSSRGGFYYSKKLILTILKSFNIFLIYGKNLELKRRMERLDSPYIRLFSFYDKIWELVCASSIIVSKPGGMTIFEGLYKKKPFIFTHYIPGQEKENMKILVKEGVAKFARGGKQLTKAIDYFNEINSKLRNNYPIEVKDIREPLSSLIERWSDD
ncbi:MAG: hypothetical protein HQ570_03715 [Candidatus Omnitrophica bacterium]|nr:hypothetical protein [Candidatus Omnitrophota bacterium]